MIGALHLAAAAALMADQTNRFSKDAVDLLRPHLEARRHAAERSKEADFVAAVQGLPIPTLAKAERDDAARRAAEEKRQRKNAKRAERQILENIRAFKRATDAIDPVEIPPELKLLGVRKIGMDIVVPAIIARSLFPEGDAE